MCAGVQIKKMPASVKAPGIKVIQLVGIAVTCHALPSADGQVVEALKHLLFTIMHRENK